jgi:hypothetical protein
LGKYADGVSVILMIGIGCLVGAALKVAEWRRTWPFRTSTAALASNGKSPMSDPAYRDKCIALPTKTRREFAEEYRPYNAMPEFSEGTMAYLATSAIRIPKTVSKHKPGIVVSNVAGDTKIKKVEKRVDGPGRTQPR